MSHTPMVSTIESNESNTSTIAPLSASSSLSLSALPAPAQGLLLRMFADPRVLSKEETANLLAMLRESVAKQPQVSELRVLLGMALCVNLDVQDAMEELGEAVRLSPDSFIAHLKMGELWMRLRVMQKAEDHTRQATLLAQNMAHSELARRQATTIRTMRREGIERGGYVWTGILSLRRAKRLFTRLWNRNRSDALGTIGEGLDTVEAQIEAQ